MDNRNSSWNNLNNEGCGMKIVFGHVQTIRYQFDREVEVSLQIEPSEEAEILAFDLKTLT